MRAGLSTIQQTLTPEVSLIINQSMSEAARRRHNQTTPLHVAATLLASPTDLFRRACVHSHPVSCHPLQCRALELCFSVALDRLPSSSSPRPDSSAQGQPPISNALMAALKRAQAHQRRGSNEQQQQQPVPPLLAVRVELEQLIVSILDDPSVSRVMREARFSSPAVKTVIQQSANIAAKKNLYLSPRWPGGDDNFDPLPFIHPRIGGSPEFSDESKPDPRDLRLPPWMRFASLGDGKLQMKEEVKKEEMLKKGAQAWPKDEGFDQAATRPYNYSSCWLLPQGDRLVRTDLVLGLPADSRRQRQLKDHPHESSLHMISGHENDSSLVGGLDYDSLKRIFSGLSEKVTWQSEAAALAAAAVVRCRGKQRGDAWLLFLGHDRRGKKKMAEALAELVSVFAPIIISLCRLPADGGAVENRGKMAVDRVAHAIRRTPCSVIVLEDIDQADPLFQKKLNQAIERGRLTDSHGQEIPLDGTIFILISHFTPEKIKHEEKLWVAASSGWQLEITIGERAAAKRRRERPWARKQCLDLNMVACDDGGTPHSCDLTDEQTDYERPIHKLQHDSPFVSDLVNAVDDVVEFKPVDFIALRRKVSEAISREFIAVFGSETAALRIEEEALDRVVGGVWFGGAAIEGWVDTVLAPALRELRSRSLTGGAAVFRLFPAKDGGVREGLPSQIRLSVA